MCGRFTWNYTWAEIHAFYRLTVGAPSNLEPRFKWPVSKRINSSRADSSDATLIERIELGPLADGRASPR